MKGTRRVKEFLLVEGTDAKYGARHLKRAIEKHVVFPLANLVATGQLKLGDFVRIDLTPEGKMVFVKEAEGALVPILLEKYGQEAAPADCGPCRAWKWSPARLQRGREPIGSRAPLSSGFLFGGLHPGVCIRATAHEHPTIYHSRDFKQHKAAEIRHVQSCAQFCWVSIGGRR
jgi:hypothetical protein